MLSWIAEYTGRRVAFIHWLDRGVQSVKNCLPFQIIDEWHAELSTEALYCCLHDAHEMKDARSIATEHEAVARFKHIADMIRELISYILAENWLRRLTAVYWWA